MALHVQLLMWTKLQHNKTNISILAIIRALNFFPLVALPAAEHCYSLTKQKKNKVSFWWLLWLVKILPFIKNVKLFHVVEIVYHTKGEWSYYVHIVLINTVQWPKNVLLQKRNVNKKSQNWIIHLPKIAICIK